MNQNLLDYIILVLVFTLVIHIFIQTFSTEKLTTSSGFIYTADNPPVRQNINLFENSNVEVRKDLNQEIFPTSIGSDRNYIQQFVLGAGKVCESDSQPMEAESYKNNFFNFGEQINKSTREGISEVDRVAEMITSRNNELHRCTGQKISDIYDNLVKSDCEDIKKCKNSGCVVPTNIDQITKSGMYSKPSAMGNTFARYDVVYETDNVNNGGKFYNDIEAFDPLSENEWK